MKMSRRLIATAAMLFASSIKAQTVQDAWITPAAPDFTSNLTIGDIYDISWDSDLINSFAGYMPSADVSNVDLWITDYSLHVYAHLIASRENLEAITLLSWRVDVPADEFLATDQWVFRWLPAGVTYSETTEQISSPGFLLQNLTAAAVTTSSSTTTSINTPSDTSTSTTETYTTSATSTATTTPQSADSTNSATSTPEIHSSSGGLSTGAKAGIAIGAVVGAAASLGLGWLLARKYGKRSGDNSRNMPSGYSAGLQET